MTLTEFLLARIADDEALAARSVQFGDKGAELIKFGTSEASPLLILSPTRVLDECAAKRRIIGDPATRGGAMYEYFLMILASVYDDHPDYRPEWSPLTPCTRG